MVTEKKLKQSRTAFRLNRWKEAYTGLSSADKEGSLKPDDLELLAIAAYLLGKSDKSHDIWSRAHNDYLGIGDVKCAVRCAFWLGFTLLNAGEPARGGGWMGRARRLLDDAHLDCVEQGYLLLPVALRSLAEGDVVRSVATLEEAGRIADRFQDADLMTLTRLGQGQALIRLGDAHKGLDLLDEAMAAVDSGEISPIVLGIVYCAVIESCLEIFDLHRAHEWTEALSDWCASQPDLVPFRGQCLIRRSEIMQLHGEWPDALEEANRASEILSRPKGEAAAGAAFYQLAELYRLRGDFVHAEEAYHQSSKYGRNPQPGFSLLRLAQGQVESAKMSIHRALQEAKNQKMRIRLLPAYVEIMLIAKDIEAARQAAGELTEIARDHHAPLLQAFAAQSEGSVLLAQGDAHAAFDKLRDACTIWNQIQAPYECARVRLLIGIACQEIGDKDNAKMEFEAAKSTFHRLQAIPDIARVDALTRGGKRRNNEGLTSRELEVLRLIANGRTNKAIANQLFISERTVERHVSNIFDKLNVSSRSAATAYAYKAQLL